MSDFWAGKRSYLFGCTTFSFNTNKSTIVMIKDLLYGKLDHGLRPVGHPKLRFKDTCKRDMIEIGLDVENWETLAADRSRWRINCSACLDEGELRIRKEAMARQERRKVALNAPPASVFMCSGCSRVCSSQIGLFSHQSRCRNMH